MHCQPPLKPQVYQWTENNQACLLCDQPADAALPLCGDCESELSWLGGHCQVCALPLPGDGLTCGACQRQPPNFTRVEAPWRYAFPIDALITRFKHQQRWPYGHLLGSLLGRHLQHAFADGLPRPDLLLPVPLAPARLRQRGFNQAELLARWLAHDLQLPLDCQMLRRTRETPAQQGLDAAARKRNLRHAFALATPLQQAGLHLALVDDVLTTGATANALGRLLLRAGAARVDLYCLARTPRPGD